MIKYRTSDGKYISEAGIKRRLSKNYRAHKDRSVCEACHHNLATEHSHIISKKRCKELGKTELIWSRKNWFYSCRQCHDAWERTYSTAWKRFKNLERLIPVLQEHDPEGYAKRMILAQ